VGEAERLDVEVVESRVQEVGAEHSDTLTSITTMLITTSTSRASFTSCTASIRPASGSLS